MRDKGLRREIVKKYLKKYPGLKKNKMRLAKLVYHDNPEVFKDVEHVRSLIRYYTGASGKINRENIKEEDVNLNTHFSWNKIPEGEKRIDWTNPYEIPGNKILILSDIHLPYHDKEALVTSLEYGYKNEVDTIYINGDLFDFYSISNYLRDPTKKRFIEEIDTARDMLKELRGNFPEKDIVFKCGNHDFWYDRYMMSKAPELYGIPHFKLENILKLKKLGIKFLGNLEWARVGKLCIAHGHEGGRSFTNPVSASRGVFLKGFENILIGHYHQASSYTDNTWSGKPITTWSTGCMCDLHPAYAPVNRWSHGFAIVERTNDAGGFLVYNKRIYKGKILPV